MAHKIVWKHTDSADVTIYERGNEKLPGLWIEESAVGGVIVIKGKSEIRYYHIREWLSSLECRATLMSVVYNTDTRVN